MWCVASHSHEKRWPAKERQWGAATFPGQWQTSRLRAAPEVGCRPSICFLLLWQSFDWQISRPIYSHYFSLWIREDGVWRWSPFAKIDRCVFMCAVLFGKRTTVAVFNHFFSCLTRGECVWCRQFSHFSPPFALPSLVSVFFGLHLWCKAASSSFYHHGLLLHVCAPLTVCSPEFTQYPLPVRRYCVDVLAIRFSTHRAYTPNE